MINAIAPGDISLRTGVGYAITAVSPTQYNLMKNPDYLELISSAHVYDVALESPLEKAERLSARKPRAPR